VRLVVTALAMLLSSCATSPAFRLDAMAQEGGAQRAEILGTTFEHVLYTRGLETGATELRIYFEGDGLPWVRRNEVSADPTPREPLALELMLEDPGPSAYVARPCYQRTTVTPACWPHLWTFARYSEEIVASMHAVVARVLDTSPGAETTLVGYSGGGVLALLVAEREPRVHTVLTIGANLDTDAWTARHGYSPLTSSINPARSGPWRSSLRQIHYAGERDDNVPETLIRSFTDDVPGAELRTRADFDHRCCWVKAWREILEEVKTAAVVGR